MPITPIRTDRLTLSVFTADAIDAMLAGGLIDEVKRLREKFDLVADMPSMRAVGYRQAWAFLEGKITERELREQGIAATRRLAKRQITWLRRLPGLEPAGELEAALTRA